MAVAQHGHLSDGSGHSAGVSRVLIVGGLAAVVGGILAFLGAVAVGMWAARDASSSVSSSATLLFLGGVAVVAGLFVTAAGMALARRAAGE